MNEMYGIIDIGSNTMRLSCYCVENGRLQQLFHKKNMAGLAGYVDESNKLTDKGIDKTIKTLESFKRMIGYVGLMSFYVIATASFRNVNNTQKIVDTIKKRTGIFVHVLSGREEAVYDFMGTKYYSDLEEGMVVDIGGGSTEIVQFIDNKIIDAESINIGSLNTYKKHVDNLFPTAEEEGEIRKMVRKKLDKLSFTGSKSLLGVGGSIRACLKLYNDYYGYKPNNMKMTYSKMHKLLKNTFRGGKPDLDRILKIIPERIHTITPGLIILDEICDAYSIKEIELSPGGLREGFMVEQLIHDN